MAMFPTRTRLVSQPRRGVILLVVLALLTLFAIIGIAFVLYASAASTSAQLQREGEAPSRPNLEPELLFSYFLGQLLYDVPDNDQGVYSGLRGHSLCRSMFGYNYKIGLDGTVQPEPNDVPFKGFGRVHTSAPGVPGLNLPGTYNNPFGLDDFSLINYTFFPSDGFLRDPERLGAFKRQGTLELYLPWRTSPRDPTQVPGVYWGGANAPYTYPDLNNLFLAAVKAGPLVLPDGTQGPEGAVVTPSFHRHWLFNPNQSFNDPGNPNWTNAEGKYLLLRPRPIDMGPGFPYPEDGGGDVKNLVSSPGYYDPVTGSLQTNDSVWIDLDFPVMTAPDGRKYKPLFAPLVLDLDNRVNLNIHGNLRGWAHGDHASNQGWGAWEVNPAYVLNRQPAEWQALLRGNYGTSGRYGLDTWPHSTMPGNLAPPGPAGKFYAPVDFDGSNERSIGAPSEPLWLPGNGPALPFQCFPFALPIQAELSGYGNGLGPERLNHPKLFNPFGPTSPDRGFDLSNLEALLRYGDTGSPALTSDLYRLCPLNFGDPNDPGGSARRRQLVTLGSFDPDRPGVSPGFWPTGATSYNRLPAGAAHPAGKTVTSLPPLRLVHPDSEFGPDGRATAALTGLRRLDLNRYLPDYPQPDETGRIRPEDLVDFEMAQRARQYLAAEIFERLWKATGTGNPATFRPPLLGGNRIQQERWEAARYLAQLAVNIVDFIDGDDYITPFNWMPPYPGNVAGEWVFGTELPRLVLNEAYVEMDNAPGGGGLGGPPTRYAINVWVELFNPLSVDPTLSHGGAAPLQIGNTPVYQVVLSRGEPNIRDRNNVLGNPINAASAITSYGLDQNKWRVPPSNGQYTQGFYVLGPSALGFLQPSFVTNEMSYQVPARSVLHGPTILLRRLACPHLPLNPVPGTLGYNPYVTIDYMEDVPYNDGRTVDAHGRPHDPTPISQRASVGRRQPFAAHQSQRRQQYSRPVRIGMPQHTFFQHNTDLETPGFINLGQPPPDYPPFDWLVHLDRPLVSPIELLHVSAYKPHELTQQFFTGDGPGQRFNHRAPWFDEDLTDSDASRSHRLYRALEFLGTRNQTIGMMTAVTTALHQIPTASLGQSSGPFPNQVVRPVAMSGQTSTGGTWRIEPGCSLVIDKGLRDNNGLRLEEVVRVKSVDDTANPRTFVADFLKPHPVNFTITPTIISERIPGKINLNTVWDEETFLALCDPQPSNSFNNPAIARAIFNQLKASRTPGSAAGPETPGPADRPFHGLASGLPLSPETGGIQETFLRSAGPGQPAFVTVPEGAHPYQTYELLGKIFNNVTVRSSVFAVWVTVGFFEVTDDRTRPVKLGAEAGKAENRHVRHRMFAIVDRSRMLANPGPQPRFDPRAMLPGTTSGLVVPYFSIID
jgi:hypothetical protein